MSVAAILLFGSLARADQSEGSDTDLLMITADIQTRHVTVGGVSLFLYPWLQLKSNAEDGDLFACHLARESKALFDPDGYLSKLKKAFRLRSDYQREIVQATDLGWFLARFGGELNPALEAKRALWCVRTILIARSAERGDPIFSPKMLADQTTSTFAREILARRHGRWNSATLRDHLRSYLEGETSPEPFHQDADRNAFIERFSLTTNKVALLTLQQEVRSQAGYT